jgi:membrane protease YdiL (CAAX protease family)
VAGVATASALAAITAAGLLAPSAGRFYQDERIVHSTTSQMLYEVLVRIPLATALPEELIFRGSLLGLLARHRPPTTAAALSSLCFGLWHVLPTFDRIQTNPGTRHAHGNPRTTAIVIAGHVASTTLMGVGLSWLRLRSGSVLAPVLAHAAPNAVGFLGGWAITHTPHLRHRLSRAVRQSDKSGPEALTASPVFDPAATESTTGR